MNFLRTGRYFGRTNKTINLNGITLTDTIFEAQDHIDWHYHENAYFALVLRGELIEKSKKKNYFCSAGSLLFHSRQEPHYNLKLKDNPRFFNLEFDENYLGEFDFEPTDFEGSFRIKNPDIKCLLYKAFAETKICDDVTPVSLQMLLFETLDRMLRFGRVKERAKPLWVNKLKEILHDDYVEKLSLLDLSKELNVHSVHLSRDFSKYFNCSFGEYVRKIRVAKSLALLSDKKLSLTEIAFECGFADQSHFLRCFKQISGINPSAYRKFLAG